MKRYSLLILSLVSIFLTSCGGGGGGSPSSPPLTPSVLTKAASSAVIKALTLGSEGVSVRQTLPVILPVSEGSETITIESRLKGGASGMGDIEKIFEKVQQFKSTGSGPAEKIFGIGTAGSIPFQQSCGFGDISHGGTEGDTSDDSFSISLNCSGFGPGGGSSASGSFSAGPVMVDDVIVQYELSYGDYTLLNRFEIQQNQNDSGIGFSTESSSRNGTILLAVAPGNCFRGSAFENVAGTFNITGTDRRDSDGNGLFEVNEAYALINLVITISETEACANGPVTITMNGTQSFTDLNDAEKSTSATFNNVQLVISPTTKSINGIPTRGFEHSLSGTMTVTSGTFCVNESHTITTVTPFFTVGTACATSGKQLLTNTVSGQVVAVSATAVGGLDIDVGDDGIIEDSFVDCKRAAVCTSP